MLLKYVLLLLSLSPLILNFLVCPAYAALLDKPACNHWGHVARVTFKSSIIGENKQHLKRYPEELLSSGHEKLKS